MLVTMFRVGGGLGRLSKKTCERRGRVYRKGFKRKDGTRVSSVCAKRSKRRR